MQMGVNNGFFIFYVWSDYFGNILRMFFMIIAFFIVFWVLVFNLVGSCLFASGGIYRGEK